MLIGKSITVQEFIAHVEKKIIQNKMRNNHLRDELNKMNQQSMQYQNTQGIMTKEKAEVIDQIRKLKYEMTELDHETDFLIDRKEHAMQSNPDQILHLNLRDMTQFGVN